MRNTVSLYYADLAANDLHPLGGASWRTQAETRAQFDALPEEPEMTEFIADLHDSRGDIVADKFLSRATVEQVMGATVEELVARHAWEGER